MYIALTNLNSVTYLSLHLKHSLVGHISITNKQLYTNSKERNILVPHPHNFYALKHPPHQILKYLMLY